MWFSALVKHPVRPTFNNILYVIIFLKNHAGDLKGNYDFFIFLRVCFVEDLLRKMIESGSLGD